MNFPWQGKKILPSLTILTLTIIVGYAAATPLSQHTLKLFAQVEENNASPAFIGVAMRGNNTSAKEHDESNVRFPKNYYEDQLPTHS